MKYIDDKLKNIPTQEMFETYIQDIKTDIETKESEKEAEKSREAAFNNNQAGFFSPENIKNLLLKHNNSIIQIERTLKKMI